MINSRDHIEHIALGLFAATTLKELIENPSEEGESIKLFKRSIEEKLNPSPHNKELFFQKFREEEVLEEVIKSYRGYYGLTEILVDLNNKDYERIKDFLLKINEIAVKFAERPLKKYYPVLS
jgi:hypothetical protein